MQQSEQLCLLGSVPSDGGRGPSDDGDYVRWLAAACVSDECEAAQRCLRYVCLTQALEVEVCVDGGNCTHVVIVGAFTLTSF